jgi:hypothetical protein
MGDTISSLSRYRHSPFWRPSATLRDPVDTRAIALNARTSIHYYIGIPGSKNFIFSNIRSLRAANEVRLFRQYRLVGTKDAGFNTPNDAAIGQRSEFQVSKAV